MKKRLILSSVLAFAALQAYAQLNPDYTYNALLFSSQYYDGTARSVGMGNAMTSLGGDLGALSYNPAASGIYRYSEITITPSVYSNVTNTSFLGNDYRSGRSRFSLSNVGWVGSFDTGRTRGLLNFNLSITANQSNNLAFSSSAQGLQNSSSYLGYLSASMTGMNPDKITMPQDGDPYRPFYYSNAAWDQILAWNTGLVDTLPGGSGNYIGATENISENGIYIPGTLIQNYRKVRTGYVEDVIINASGNIDNIFFFGVNLTLQSIWSSEYTAISETAGNPSNFSMETGGSGFTDFTREYRMTTSGMGVNVEAGFIVRPVAGLTVGGSISTPTWMYLNETYMMSMSGYTAQYGGAAIDSPVGEYSYRVTSPFRWNLGIGYTIGNFMAIGVDYERTDYSGIFMSDYNGDRNAFASENEYMSKYYQSVNNVRAGIEAWPIPQLAIRLGYNYYGSSEKNFNSERHYASAGIGFRTASGFFIDAAYQQQCNDNDLTFALYPDYDNSTSPVVSERFFNWKVLLTIGWRF